MAAELITRFVAGEITNEEFVDSYPTANADRALKAIGFAMWGLYDDLSTHYADPSIRQSPPTMALVNRCISFLRSALEYRWPRFCAWRPMLAVYKVLNRIFPGSPALGNPEVWPFFDEEEEERLRQNLSVG